MRDLKMLWNSFCFGLVSTYQRFSATLWPKSAPFWKQFTKDFATAVTKCSAAYVRNCKGRLYKTNWFDILRNFCFFTAYKFECLQLTKPFVQMHSVQADPQTGRSGGQKIISEQEFQNGQRDNFYGDKEIISRAASQRHVAKKSYP